MKRVFLLLSGLCACIIFYGQAPKLANTLKNTDEKLLEMPPPPRIIR